MLQAILHREEVGVFTAEMLDQAARTLHELDRLAPESFVLFPGLDGLSQWLRRYYGPKTPG